MSRQLCLRIVFLLFCATLVGSNALATTYYVDNSSTGCGGSGCSDSNAGTSQTTAWVHAPGMHDCTATCASATISGGDSIILRGGDTWGNASFAWNVPGGSSDNPVYVGVDKSWYSSSSWSRPVLDAGGAIISNNNDTMFLIAPWVTLDNLEVTGFYWDNATCASAPFGSCSIFSMGQNDGVVVESSYVHGWTHGSSSTIVENVWTGECGPHCDAKNNVISGADHPTDFSMGAYFGGPCNASGNVIEYTENGFVITPQGCTPAIIHDNLIAHIGTAYCNTSPGLCDHENGFEDNADTGLIFYNNVIYDTTSDGLAVWFAPDPGYTDYIFNNVIYGVHNSQVDMLAPPVYDSSYCSAGATSNNYCLKTGNQDIWNNTIQCGDDSAQYNVCTTSVGNPGSGSQANSVDYANNMIIGTGTSGSCATGAGAPASCTFASSNILMTQSTATADGYTSSETFPFSPSASNSPTVGRGTNLTTSAVGNLAGLASSTTDACKYVTSNHTVSCPARTPVSRGSTWDVGAYQYTSNSTSSGSQPPTPVLTGSIVQQ